jgi:hypothetical protein
MLFHPTVLVFVLLQLPLFSLQTSSSHGRLSQAKKPRQNAPKGERVPLGLDVEHMPLKQLVDMRSSAFNADDSRRFKEYFARHPQIRRINLYDSATANTAQQFLALSSEGSYDRGSKLKLAAAINAYIGDSFDRHDKLRQDLLEDVQGARHRNARIRDRALNLTRPSKEERYKRRKNAEKKHQAQVGHGYGKTRKLARLDPIKDKTLSFHLDADGALPLSAREVEILTRGLSPFYTTEKLLTRALEQYLKDKNIPEEERNAAMGIRQRRTTILAREKLRSRREKAALAFNARKTHDQSTRGTFASVRVGESSANSLPSVNRHQPPLSPLQHDDGGIDVEDEADWQWLNSVLHP